MEVCCLKAFWSTSSLVEKEGASGAIILTVPGVHKSAGNVSLEQAKQTPVRRLRNLPDAKEPTKMAIGVRGSV